MAPFLALIRLARDICNHWIRVSEKKPSHQHWSPAPHRQLRSDPWAGQPALHKAWSARSGSDIFPPAVKQWAKRQRQEWLLKYSFCFASPHLIRFVSPCSFHFVSIRAMQHTQIHNNTNYCFIVHLFGILYFIVIFETKSMFNTNLKWVNAQVL